jgi:2,3-bisphosphoglycerate-dependent phosphoglycerate mutase
VRCREGRKVVSGAMPTLVVLRHGESTWNAENRFTGWTDVGLSAAGEAEAHEAGRLLAAEVGLGIDTVHTSVLARAVETANLALGEMSRSYLPVRRSWRLNERHYGALQGLNKKETAEQYGSEQVKAWRRSYATPPPSLETGDPRHPVHDPRYRDVPPSCLPGAECLADVVVRMVPYWEDALGPELLAGRTPLVVAHGNSIRALWKFVEHISDDDIVDLEVPTGWPRVVSFDDRLGFVEGRYLGDPAAVKAAAEAVARQAGP